MIEHFIHSKPPNENQLKVSHVTTVFFFACELQIGHQLLGPSRGGLDLQPAETKGVLPPAQVFTATTVMTSMTAGPGEVPTQDTWDFI